MAVIVEVSLVPIGSGETGVSKYVAAAVKALEEQAQKSGLRYQVTAMGTNIEGDLDAVWQAVRAMQEAVFAMGEKRVYTVMKIDDRRDKEESIARKVEAVREKGVPVEKL